MAGNEQRLCKASPKTGEAFVEFCETIGALREPDGCPWDREQTHASIASSMIEEACEAVDAIEKGDPEHLREELGDVLLQVVLQAQIASEAGEFTIDDVIADIQAKMVRRHPHVFGAETALTAAGFSPEEIAEATTPGKVLDMWEHIKTHERLIKEERRRQKAIAAGFDPDRPAGLLDDIPSSLPALQQADKISKRAVSAGFSWDTVEDVWDKVDEEVGEFNEALEEGESEHAAEEFGDVLFTLVNVARMEHIDSEGALRAVCAKFRKRWAIMEQYAYEDRGVSLDELSRDQLESLWERAKRDLRKDQQ
ncbi:MAG: nucleoside triphosphate pyrophosphohydrolase [Coriobacteriales bacterium]|jgi:tetrapyrrole methylase family protein/MazG family protein